MNRNNVSYDPYTNEQKAELKQKAFTFLDAKDEELEFDSIRAV
eukprot:CAMPEP_0116914054 /NCGR_PEP_ID=MMETSP0467-20121206/17091_1 /TAXON_ID=283647 /ORGANISM="Mesodinium pulex, Strain SPMC105" /LENGTH=42 /DNA_ID= /DNA_START= /DNA_END= /DNA_ORIENTATION=